MKIGAAFQAPAAGLFLSHLSTSLGKAIVNITNVQDESTVQLNSIADELERKPVAGIWDLCLLTSSSYTDIALRRQYPWGGSSRPDDHPIAGLFHGNRFPYHPFQQSIEGKYHGDP
jgi:hypothetical protein